MVNTELIFFGTLHDSYKGTLRGCISFFPLCVLFFLLFPSYTIHSLCLALILCSAVGVQLPTSNKVAILYGLLVGLCISICSVCMYDMISDTNELQTNMLVFVCGFSVLIGSMSYLTRFVSTTFGLYPS
jgi:hypothetical protein